MNSVAKAWPHFVSRIELDVELKALSGRLDEVWKRLTRTEPLIAALDAKVEELLDRCGGDSKVGTLATQAELSDLEMRCGQQVSKETLELSIELEELRQSTAPGEALEGLRAEHLARLEALAANLHRVQDSLVAVALRQQAESQACAETYVSKFEHQESSAQQSRDTAETRAQLQQATASIEATERGRRQLGAELEQLSTAMAQQEVTSKVQEGVLQQLRRSLSQQELQAAEDFAAKAELQQVYSLASEAHTKLDFAMMDRATIRRTMEEEFGVVKKTLYRQQGSFQEMDAAVASTFQQQQQLSGFRERLDQQQTGVQELAKQHQLQQQQLEELALQRARDQRYLEELCDSLQQHVDEKVSKCQAAADSLSTCSTRISLEQMDTSLALRRSLDHLSQEHRQLKSQLQGADQVKVTRGEDGWEIARSAGLD